MRSRGTRRAANGGRIDRTQSQVGARRVRRRAAGGGRRAVRACPDGDGRRARADRQLDGRPANFRSRFGARPATNELLPAPPRRIVSTYLGATRSWRRWSRPSASSVFRRTSTIRPPRTARTRIRRASSDCARIRRRLSRWRRISSASRVTRRPSLRLIIGPVCRRPVVALRFLRRRADGDPPARGSGR